MFSLRVGWLIMGVVSFGGIQRMTAQDSTAVQYRYPDGTVSSEGMLVNGVPQGYWVSYYPDGTAKSEGNWRAGRLEGDWVFYDEQGRVETTLHYEGGWKDGEEVQWDSTGTRIRSLPWVVDTLNGVESVFDATGIEVERIPWKAGQREGVALTFAVENGVQTRIVRRQGFRDDLLRWVEDINRYDDQGRRTGKWMRFWSQGVGVIREEGSYERGLKEGVFKYFSRNGDLERTETYKRGERVEDAPEAVALDLRKAFHPNGEVSREGPWRDNTPMGTHRFYDEEGHMVEVKVFRQGVLSASGMLDSLGRRTGPWLVYWPDGSVKESGEYLAGVKEGDWTYFRRDGETEQEGGYRQGQWHGVWTWYHPGGKLHRRERYRKGREDGDFVELSMSGDTLARGVYERGLKQGPWLEHVEDDRKEGVYLDGERDGVWRHFDDEGFKRFEGEYVAGIPMGEHTGYWSGGTRAWVGSYSGGLPEGNWRYFDELGMVRLIRQYKAGRIARVNGAKTDR